MELFDLNRFGKLLTAEFNSRPNRFVGDVTVNNSRGTCHISDTGRLAEILVPGRQILLVANPPHLKTDYRLLACKMEEWVLINTSIHTHIARAAILGGKLGFGPRTVRPEVSVGSSRLDFLIDDHLFVELKGTNLIKNGQCQFPDAPTARGRRHLRELSDLAKQGKDAMILMLGLRKCPCFRPNKQLDPEFSSLFYEALRSGVQYCGFRVSVDIEDGKIRYDGNLPLCREVRDA